MTPLSWVYGAIAKTRWGLTEGNFSEIPVICIGNFTAGGGGKTPSALMTASLLKSAGHQPYFLSRGYGGNESGPHLVDAKRDRAKRVGDEPILLARSAPTVVARDRLAGARFARAHGAEIVIMDDGFQNPSLAKDLSIIALDAAVGIGNALCIPAGPLRAPLDTQIERADALVLIGRGSAGDHIAEQFKGQGKPVFRGDYEVIGEKKWLRESLLVAFAGIARPQKFFATLEEQGARVCEKISFPDHHSFSEADAVNLLALSKINGAHLVTTEKDWVRLQGASGERASLGALSQPLPIALRLTDEKAFLRLIDDALSAH